MMERELREKLLKLAAEARDHSYSPYSHYSVGAALLTKDGKIYQGCNIENASFTPTICAERTAFFKAIFDGVREFAAIAIIGSGDSPAFPCGVCRQVMSEFCDGEFVMIVANRDGSEVVVETLDQMMPHRFGPKDLL
jgi:cytidine deaminase